VLVEMGFLSNAEEEKWLASAEGKTGIVNGIFDAFEKFYSK
jgi:N-acetylmuramoyl-L-alanine amidase